MCDIDFNTFKAVCMNCSEHDKCGVQRFEHFAKFEYPEMLEQDRLRQERLNLIFESMGI